MITDEAMISRKAAPKPSPVNSRHRAQAPDRAAINHRRAGQTANQLMMVDIILRCGSMAHWVASTILPKIPISIEAPIAAWKINGPSL
jgi:hypothetical protein